MATIKIPHERAKATNGQRSGMQSRHHKQSFAVVSAMQSLQLNRLTPFRVRTTVAVQNSQCVARAVDVGSNRIPMRGAVSDAASYAARSLPQTLMPLESDGRAT